MSAAEYVRDHAMPCALKLLPSHMDSQQARVMLMAIGFHESAFEHRRQIRGPAVSWWMFERDGGIKGVLNHKASRALIRGVLDQMGYDHFPETSYQALTHNDLLAAVYARLLLWTHPAPLPAIGDEAETLKQYLDVWRPGKSRLDAWIASYGSAMDALA